MWFGVWGLGSYGDTALCGNGLEFTIFSHSIKRFINTSNLRVTFPDSTDCFFLKYAEQFYFQPLL